MTVRLISLIAILALTAGMTLAQHFEFEIKKAFVAHHGESINVVHETGAGLDTVTQALRLTDAQSNNLRSLMDAKTQETRTLIKELEQKRESLHRALEEPSPNATEIGTLTVAVQELERRSTAIQERFQSAFSNMLSADQRAAFEGLKAAAKQLQAFHAAGLIDPSMMHHEFMMSPEAHGVFMKKLEIR